MKRFITLNIQSDKGKCLLKRLVQQSDVLIENFRPGVLDGLGLGYKALSAVNPRLVMTSISGFGQFGPYKDRLALDQVAQAMGGWMNMTGFPDGPPVKAGLSLADFTTGLYGAFGTTLALFHRERSGIGQHVDIAMLDSVFSFMENLPTIYLLLGKELKRAGNGRLINGPSGSFAASDGYVYIAATAITLHQRLMHLVGHSEMATDLRFVDDSFRKEHEKEIDSVIIPWIAERTMAQAMQELDKAGIPNGPVNTIAKISNDPHIQARNMIVDVDHPTIGKLPLVNFPIKMSCTPPTIRRSPGLLGQHNEEVYSMVLHLQKEEVSALKEEGII